MNNLDCFHKQIDLLQGCINRMANNSFLIKSWTVGLIVLILTITRDSTWKATVIVFLPLLAFWYLDAYFLEQERCYRARYQELVQTDEFDRKFYELNPKTFNQTSKCVCCTMFSTTLLFYYGTITGLTILLSCLLKSGFLS
ncbi:MAG: hypothetical protein K0R66_873 [Gammaproteobacteria bacterium]|jgi:hypothetical protein|nr:hypothetical protein [Gammaproteobacteria bacterium]